ncbi:serine/threonine-protein phosphatase 2A activator 2 [Ascodesmis nigricans]|uniref:Serine/threonine-protein phosphatase 2A activator n=1 Tax=Ascodesmis nigricans TaxID=341454 RepID=A0A4S2N874_9PEZI|nr:serine/threonine-protein phosphatase 2A activator 2 [Ascodesmis nigricans]
MPISLNRAPPPPAPGPPLTPAPPPLSSFTFTIPTRQLVTSHHLTLFQSSAAHSLLVSFITDLNNSVINLPNSANVPEPPIIDQLLALIQRVEKLVGEHPPEEQGGSRFGNHAFRGWYDDVWRGAEGWHRELLGLGDGAEGKEEWRKVPKEGVEEVTRYFKEAWGNRTRIDYGSGHELNFIAWLLCLHQLGLIPQEAYSALVLRVFTAYLKTMRILQTTYYLEPAGSHGVWGLDDYQFLPFLFGSAQLYSHPHIRPKAIHSPDVLDFYAHDYMYLGCIAFINSIKTTAGLRWHSPMLDDISAAQNWGKINNGMLKMWMKEVLGKLPVVQHFMFGGILKAAEGMGEETGEEDREGMRHVHSTWGECCGIKVPAAVAARKAEEGRELRRIPFD